MIIVCGVFQGREVRPALLQKLVGGFFTFLAGKILREIWREFFFVGGGGYG